MLKIFIVMVPMIVGAALAGAVRAETLIDVPTDVTSAAVAASSEQAPEKTFANLDQVSSAHLPEPASWAIMITGIGIVGGVTRRRRGALTAA